MQQICFNGEWMETGSAVLDINNNSYKWGEGLFETMKIHQGRILLKAYHFERLFQGMQLLQIKKGRLDETYLSQLVIEICNRNQTIGGARVRLHVFRAQNNIAGFSIESIPWDDHKSHNEKEYRIDIYPFARKSMDAFANLKSANFLPYAMASMHAKEKGWNEAIVLNTSQKMADCSKANIWLIKGKELFTPALHQGCVNGVMRRFLLDELQKMQYTIHQDVLEEKDLYEADEVFLTNAMVGMQSVSGFREKNYGSEFCMKVWKILSGKWVGSS